MYIYIVPTNLGGITVKRVNRESSVLVFFYQNPILIDAFFLKWGFEIWSKKLIRVNKILLPQKESYMKYELSCVVNGTLRYTLHSFVYVSMQFLI